MVKAASGHPCSWHFCRGAVKRRRPLARRRAVRETTVAMGVGRCWLRGGRGAQRLGRISVLDRARQSFSRRRRPRDRLCGARRDDRCARPLLTEEKAWHGDARGPARSFPVAEEDPS